MSQRAIVITGGCRGIGRAIVDRFLQGGERVLVADILPPPHDLKATDGVTFLRCDLGKAEEIRSFVNELRRSHRQVEILINNAACGFEPVDLAEMSLHHWEEVLNTNLRGTVWLTRLLLPSMLEKRKGVIINISSSSAYVPEAGRTAYASSKAGLIAFTRSLAREIGPYGLRCLCLVPGWIATENNLPDEESKVWLKENVSLGRAGEPAEIAEVIWFLTTPAASYINGQAILVDGGMI